MIHLVNFRRRGKSGDFYSCTNVTRYECWVNFFNPRCTVVFEICACWANLWTDVYGSSVIFVESSVNFSKVKTDQGRFFFMGITENSKRKWSTTLLIVLLLGTTEVENLFANRFCTVLYDDEQK